MARVREWGMENTQHPQMTSLGAGSDESLVSCPRAFPSPGRIPKGQDPKDLKEGFGQGSPVSFLRGKGTGVRGGERLCSASPIGQKM